MTTKWLVFFYVVLAYFIKEVHLRAYWCFISLAKNEAKTGRALPPVQTESRSPRTNISDSPALPPISNTTYVDQTITAVSPIPPIVQKTPEPQRTTPIVSAKFPVKYFKYRLPYTTPERCQMTCYEREKMLVLLTVF